MINKMHTKILIALLALVTSVDCGPPESNCKQRNIAHWTRATVIDSTPIIECGYVVGYRMDINAHDGQRMWSITNDEPHLLNGRVDISAEIDQTTGVERSASLVRGPATYDLQSNNVGLVVSASTNTTAGPLLREFRIKIPAGVRYIGEIRNLRW